MSSDVETSEKNPFKSPKVIPILIAVFFLLFIGGLLLVTFAEPKKCDSRQHTRSYSAVGYHALFTVLTAHNFDTLRVYQNFYIHETGKTIVFLEPDFTQWHLYAHEELQHSIKKILIRGNDVVIVCPKWEILHYKKKEKWIKDCQALSIGNVEKFLNELNVSLDVVRRVVGEATVTTNWESQKRYQIQSNILQVFQRKHRTRPVIVTGDGDVLACEMTPTTGSGKLYLFSDPDIFNNMLLDKKENGKLAVSFFERVSPEKRLWFDEISHGYGKAPSIIHSLLSYPAIFITLQALIIGIFLVWFTGIRFRPPLPVPIRSRSVEEQIKAFSNITCTGSRHDYFLQKYIKSIIQELTEHYPSIISLPFDEKIKYLDAHGVARNNPYSIKNLYQKSLKVKRPRNIVIIAKGIYKWKERMIPYKKYNS